MEQEPRKATDVLLDLESKVNILLDLVRAQDLVIKVLSNKLNDVISRLDKRSNPPKIVVETTTATPKQAFPAIPAGDPERTIPVVAELSLPQTNSPQGFRRNSRPETYAPKTVPQIPMQPPPQQQQLGDDPVEIKMPVQIPQMPGRQGTMVPPPGRGPGSEVVVSPNANQVPGMRKGNIIAPPDPKGSPFAQTPLEAQAQHNPMGVGQIPVSQRCVDKNGKSIFLAEVEILDLGTLQPVSKSRTNATGKWFASLGIGSYRVSIRKRESVTKEKIEAVQDIQVDGSVSKLELPMLIIKPTTSN